MARSQGGHPIRKEHEGIRWTRTELDTFARLGVSINVLEYFVAIFYVIVGG